MNTFARLLEAMAYAGAFFDPTGALLVARERARRELHASERPPISAASPSSTRSRPNANA
jgi:hypothetical protein